MAKEIILTVTGMSCGGCSGSVNKVVGKVNGVATVNAEHQPINKVTVTGEDFDEEAVRAAIIGAGFTVEA
eukprot:CAMPEP_0183347224 /NCGR_PEP_ID=MMETSP0164_2-20130417/12109_1 /TAXON_ID=221442 /ORGANISM="Coccolithus pelagicus ssp braarudi, Strain PLY182g" /LENGTH=69 /DNA_ID=CAMNT_0025518615 /DNA_START=51 /DNA_END=260 /DNA_ORIENTATION=+